jgi:hypothetical protein
VVDGGGVHAVGGARNGGNLEALQDLQSRGAPVDGRAAVVVVVIVVNKDKGRDEEDKEQVVGGQTGAPP